MEPEKVDELSPDIDGMKLYEVHTTPESWKQDTRDMHYFVLCTVNKQGFIGVRKGGQCHGSSICPNEKCTFQSTSQGNQSNRINWKY